MLVVRARRAGLGRRRGDRRPACRTGPKAEKPPSHLGPYRILREIGRGGMATVYEAERDDREFERKVAVKVIRRGMDTADIVRRLRRERQILANLDHPNIARLLDGGTDRRRPALRGDGVHRRRADRPLLPPPRPRRSRPGCEPSARSAARCTSPTAAWCCTATSSRRTSWSPPRAAQAARLRHRQAGGRRPRAADASPPSRPAPACACSPRNGRAPSRCAASR